jgi:hypothetical protein
LGFFFFFKYIVEKKTIEKEKLTYGTNKVEGVSFPIHGGKDVDKGEMIGMQPKRILVVVNLPHSE